MFTQTGGINTVANLYIANGKYDYGIYEMSGGQLSATSEYIGYTSVGNFVQTGGTNTITGDLNIAVKHYPYPGMDYVPVSGTYTLSGGTLKVGGNIIGGEGL